jgi:hypothetical protein
MAFSFSSPKWPRAKIAIPSGPDLKVPGFARSPTKALNCGCAQSAAHSGTRADSPKDLPPPPSRSALQPFASVHARARKGGRQILQAIEIRTDGPSLVFFKYSFLQRLFGGQSSAHHDMARGASNVLDPCAGTVSSPFVSAKIRQKRGEGFGLKLSKRTRRFWLPMMQPHPVSISPAPSESASFAPAPADLSPHAPLPGPVGAPPPAPCIRQTIRVIS